MSSSVCRLYQLREQELIKLSLVLQMLVKHFQTLLNPKGFSQKAPGNYNSSSHHITQIIADNSMSVYVSMFSSLLIDAVFTYVCST